MTIKTRSARSNPVGRPTSHAPLHHPSLFHAGRTQILALLALGAASFTSPAFALSLGGGSAPQGAGAGVYGYSHTAPGGILATKMQVAEDASWVAQTVDSAIQRVGQALTDGQRHEITAQTKLLNTQTQDLETMFKQLFKAQRAARKQALFSRSNQPAGYCGNPALGQGIGDGYGVRNGVAGKMAASDAQWNTSVSVPGQNRMALVKMTPQDLSASTLFGKDGSITDQNAAQALQQVLTNPHPAVKMPKGAKKTAAGQKYLAEQHVSQARLSIAQNTLREVALDHTPTLPLGDWAKSAWKQAGFKGTPKGVVKGNISPMALNELEVRTRVGNPRWYTKISTEDRTGLLRELALMRAQSMRMRLESLKLQNKVAAMVATEYAMTMHKSTAAKLRTDRANAIQGGENQ